MDKTEVDELKKLRCPIYNRSIGDLLNGKDFFSEKRNELCELILDISHTPEFRRLHGIKQEGILSLSYLDANQTLFQRSIGNVILGFNAIENIVKIEDTKKTKLSDYIEKSGIEKEFTLALLLKNVGMPPFYDILEQNGLLSGYNPYKVAVDIINGDCEISEQFDSLGHETISDVLNNYERPIDYNILSKFIYGMKSKIQAEPQESMDMFNHVIGGILDLDSIDRCKRLLENMGTNSMVCNISNFFSKIYVDSDDLIRFKKIGITSAYNYLTNRDRILSKKFDDPKVLVNYAMVGQVIREYFGGSGDNARKEFMFLSDSQAINKLSSVSESTTNLWERMAYGKPYAFYGSGVLKNEIDINSVIIDNLGGSSYNSSDVLVLRSPNGVLTDDNWLNLRCEYDDKLLFEDEANSKLYRFLKKNQEVRGNTAYIFVSEIRTSGLDVQALRNISGSLF